MSTSQVSGAKHQKVIFEENEELSGKNLKTEIIMDFDIYEAIDLSSRKLEVE